MTMIRAEWYCLSVSIGGILIKYHSIGIFCISIARQSFKQTIHQTVGAAKLQSQHILTVKRLSDIWGSDKVGIEQRL